MRSAAGSIRKRTVTRKGHQYTYWEGRYTVGYDPGTGKQLQKYVQAKTQKEVRQKLTEAQGQIDTGSYKDSDKITMGQWLDIWQDAYLSKQAALTVNTYKSKIKNHIRPGLGAVRLDRLTADQIQLFQKDLSAKLAPKTVRDTMGVLHSCLTQAVVSGRLKSNPADGCVNVKVKRKKIKTMEPEQLASFLEAAEADGYRNLFILVILTGMRIGELCGLQWSDVDFKKGLIHVQHQLQRVGGAWVILDPKDDEFRTLAPARSAMEALWAEKQQQDSWKEENTDFWESPYNLVFTNSLGHNLCPRTVEKHYKKILQAAGIPDMRFHDLRHTYASNSLEAGDDIKTVQENMGHATAAFTLATYAHLTNHMRRSSGERMQGYLDSLKGKQRGNPKTENPENSK